MLPSEVVVKREFPLLPSDAILLSAARSLCNNWQHPKRRTTRGGTRGGKGDNKKICLSIL